VKNAMKIVNVIRRCKYRKIKYDIEENTLEQAFARQNSIRALVPSFCPLRLPRFTHLNAFLTEEDERNDVTNEGRYSTILHMSEKIKEFRNVTSYRSRLRYKSMNFNRQRTSLSVSDTRLVADQRLQLLWCKYVNV
jgi:hypothetical protein